MKITSLVFYVNGKKINERNADPEWTLAYYLREKCEKPNDYIVICLETFEIAVSLCGTKLACQVGACGSCTVVIGEWVEETGKPRYYSANACISPLYLVHGKAITTVEGLGSVKLGLHAVQERLSMGHGSQCGFCTPGFVMSMFALLRNNPNPVKEDIEMHLRGNLCRCTGYRPIVQSFHTFEKGCSKQNCCQKKPGDKSVPLTDWTMAKEYDPTQDPIFPPELQMKRNEFCGSLYLKGPRTSLYCPKNLQEYFTTVNENKQMKLVASGISLILSSHKNLPISSISVANVQELHQVKSDGNGIQLGAGLSIQQLQDVLEKELKAVDTKHGFIPGLLCIINQYSSPQTKNSATWCGNLLSTGFVSDLKTTFLCGHFSLLVSIGKGNQLQIPVTEGLFNENGIPNLPPGSLVTAILIPKSRKNDYFLTMKQGTRHGPESAIVNAAVYLDLDEKNRILNCRVAFGGLSKAPILCPSARKLIGKKLSPSVLDEASSWIAENLNDICPGSGDPEKYKKVLALSMFHKLCHSLSDIEQGPEPVSASMISDIVFNEIGSSQPAIDPVGRPVMTQSGKMHTTGEATYTDDVKVIGMCHGAVVQSTKAKAIIKCVDASEALNIPNVLAFVDKRDIPVGGCNFPSANITTMIGPDDLAFADGKVTSIGQVIGAIIAEDALTARYAAKLVKVEYEDKLPDITIQQANHNECFMDEPIVHKLGGEDVEMVLSKCENKLQGTVQVGGQEHFYMENNCSIALPQENDEMLVYCSTQYPAAVQADVSRLICVPNHKVVVKLRRIGGGFGGKASTHGIALFPAVLGALKLGRPVKISLSRYEDIIITGKRHPVKADFEVGFAEDGKLQALKVNALMDCGHTHDISPYVGQLFTSRFDHAYNIASIMVETKLLRTNIPSNTAFRGFGCPQAFFMMESIIDRVSKHLNLPPEQVRRKNFALAGSKILNGGTITETNDYLLRCWEECLQVSNYAERRQEVDSFNKSNLAKQRGLVIMPTRFGIGVAGIFFEQGHALLHVYKDGSVLISHGGVEIGQGINTKVMQVASRILQLPMDRITITDNSTDKVPNASCTSGSIGADIWGLAIKNACEELMQRLEPVMVDKPNAGWDKWIEMAYLQRIGLSITGLSKPPFECRAGLPRYYVCGAVCTEVEIDCLTGDHTISQTDIVIDIGDSLNPAIDIGQIEGGFVQGYGYFTSEEVLYSKEGRLLTNSALSYKIPNALSIPRNFNVVLLRGSPERNNLFSSKGIGEPSLFLGCSVFLAISDAVNSHRVNHGLPPVFMDSPATPGKIRLACDDALSQLIL